jgi:hypothetical protein
VVVDAEMVDNLVDYGSPDLVGDLLTEVFGQLIQRRGDHLFETVGVDFDHEPTAWRRVTPVSRKYTSVRSLDGSSSQSP